MNNNHAINIVRWVIAVPAGLLLWFAANFSIGQAFGIIHGFDRVDAFWEASGMDGVPVIGTYIIFVTRAIAAASLVGMVVFMVPRHHKQVGIIVACIVSIAAVGFSAFRLFQIVNSDLNIGPDGWYRHALEVFSMIFGAIAGAWLANLSQRKVRRPG